MVNAKIRKIHLKVYYNVLNLAAGHTNAIDSVLINSSGTQLYTSDHEARVFPTAVAAPANTGVHYMIIPKADRIDNLPFTLGGKGND